MAAVDALFFDFDGTLFDTSEAIRSSFDGALAAIGAPASDAEFVSSRIGRPLREMFGEARPGATVAELDRLTTTYRRIFLEDALALIRPFPSVLPSVERLSRDHPLAIVTSRLADVVVALLESHGVRGCFSVVVDLADVSRPKPDPEPLILAAARLGVDVTRSVMVGDTPDDVRAATAASALPVGVTTGVFDAAALRAAGAAHVIPRLDHLLELPELQ